MPQCQYGICFLHYGNEVGRHEQTALWMIPANKRLHTGNSTREEFDLRLIVKFQLVLFRVPVSNRP